MFRRAASRRDGRGGDAAARRQRAGAVRPRRRKASSGHREALRAPAATTPRGGGSSACGKKEGSVRPAARVRWRARHGRARADAEEWATAPSCVSLRPRRTRLAQCPAAFNAADLLTWRLCSLFVGPRDDMRGTGEIFLYPASEAQNISWRPAIAMSNLVQEGASEISSHSVDSEQKSLLLPRAKQRDALAQHRQVRLQLLPPQARALHVFVPAGRENSK